MIIDDIRKARALFRQEYGKYPARLLIGDDKIQEIGNYLMSTCNNPSQTFQLTKLLDMTIEVTDRPGFIVQ